MLSVSFTAARDLGEYGAQVICNVLAPWAPEPGWRFVTGGARGGDAVIGRWLMEAWPCAEHVVVLPANQAQTDPWWLEMDCANLTLIKMGPGTTYADRNARLAHEGDAVVGFPAREEHDPRSRRSGTWQTLRMARHAGKLSQWHCVQPPYHGRIERYLSDFASQALLPL